MMKMIQWWKWYNDENDNHHNNSYDKNDGTDDKANYNDDVDDDLKADRSYSSSIKIHFLKNGST